MKRKSDKANTQSNGLKTITNGLGCAIPPENGLGAIPPALPPLKPNMKNYLSAIGKKGGLIGGKNRMNKLTPEERTALAMLGVEARRKNKATRLQHL